MMLVLLLQYGCPCKVHRVIKFLASIVPDGSSSAEAALKGSNPLIDNREVGDVTSIDLRSILNREWLGGQKVVFSVTAIIPGRRRQLVAQCSCYFPFE